MAFHRFSDSNSKFSRRSHFLKMACDSVELAERVAQIINPVCQKNRLGVQITGGQCFIKNKKIALPDENPYEVDFQEDPLSRYVDQMQLTVLLPNPACLAKFKQMIPSIKEALQGHGIVSIEVKGKVVPSAYSLDGR